ncbi:MAG: hypothetical protein HFI08_01100 [Bacilli bacterium]|jgi:hypothetical protein|nr:hypothetical protein [Bacilli bacterium]
MKKDYDKIVQSEMNNIVIEHGIIKGYDVIVFIKAGQDHYFFKDSFNFG